MQTYDSKTVIHTFMRTVNHYIVSAKKPYDYGIGSPLYRSEIHTIESIGANDRINITGLANDLGITKSAASQMTDRLVKKGLVVKTVLSKSDTEVALTLTPKGETVFRVHRESHQKLYAYVRQALSDVSDRDIRIFMDIMARLDSILSE